MAIDLEELSGYASTEEARQAALAAGMEVVDGKPYTLLLDLDTPAARSQYLAMRDLLAEVFGVKSEKRWTSKGGNTHVEVEIRGGLSAAERCALQVACGSDPRRGLLTVRDLAVGEEEPNMLFRPAGAKVLECDFTIPVKDWIEGREPAPPSPEDDDLPF